MSSADRRPGVFLDRDGTIIDDAHYIANPQLVRLRPGAGRAIARLNEAAIPVIVVTNQSGIARKMLTRAEYDRVAARVTQLLAEAGAHVDATYLCPHHPKFNGPCDCRKPGTLLFRRAAEEYGIDLRRSTYIGDRWRDVEPAMTLGGRPILIADDATDPEERTRAEHAGIEIVASLAAAVERVFVGRGVERGTSH
jgi:histidinol-phosphate phosphatase family protein